MEKGSIVLQRTNGSSQRLRRQGRVALSVDNHQLWHSSSRVEIKFEYVSGHLPANFFTEEIELIKDRVAIMLFKLQSVFVSTGRHSDKTCGKDKSRSFLTVAAYEHCVTIKHFR